MINISKEFLNKFSKTELNLNNLKRYIKFINAIQIENRTIKIRFKQDYHHILPKSIFPEFKKNKENLIILNHREHFIAHLILTRIFNNQCKPLLFAFNTMNNTRNLKRKKSNNRLYAKERFEVKKRISENSIKFWKESDPEVILKHNKKHSETLRSRSKEKIASQTKRMLETIAKRDPEKTRDIRRRIGIGSKKNWDDLKKNSPELYRERCEKRRENAKRDWENSSEEKKLLRNKKNSESQKNLSILTCPYCGFKSRSRGNMKRYHMENCLKNPNLTKEQLEEIERKRMEYRKKNSEGQVYPEEKTCPYCGFKSKNKAILRKQHFDNCKLKGN